MERDWVGELITRFDMAKNGTIDIKIGDTVISTTIATDIIDYFKLNKTVLLRIGLDTFKQFLLLLAERKEEQAFNLIISKMSADDMISRMHQNSVSLNQSTLANEAFIESLKKFAINTLTPAILKTVISLLI